MHRGQRQPDCPLFCSCHCPISTLRLIDSRWYQEYLSLPANWFCLYDGRANVLEGKPTWICRTFQNAIAHERDHLLDQMMSRCLIKPGEPVAEPEHFHDATARQNETWLGSYLPNPLLDAASLQRGGFLCWRAELRRRREAEQNGSDAEKVASPNARCMALEELSPTRGWASTVTRAHILGHGCRGNLEP